MARRATLVFLPTVLLTARIFVSVLAVVRFWGRIRGRPDSMSPAAVSSAVVCRLYRMPGQPYSRRA